ncbi:N-acetylmuramoyl-L-alanine amidase, partial [Paracoccus liaowanqingii]
AAAHASVMMLARLLSHRPGAEALPLSRLLALPRAAAMGLSPRTHHTRLPVAIAQVRDGAFVPLRSMAPIEGDPYLTLGLTPGREAPPALRVVT